MCVTLILQLASAGGLLGYCVRSEAGIRSEICVGTHQQRLCFCRHRQPMLNRDWLRGCHSHGGQKLLLAVSIMVKQLACWWRPAKSPIRCLNWSTPSKLYTICQHLHNPGLSEANGYLGRFSLGISLTARLTNQRTHICVGRLVTTLYWFKRRWFKMFQTFENPLGACQDHIKRYTDEALMKSVELSQTTSRTRTPTL